MRIYHPYWKWEDYKNGMWSKVDKADRQRLLDEAVKFTGNAKLYGSYMLRVISEWPISCEQNLMESGTNKLAWIGHAATAMAIGCPEDITRKAWGMLSDLQQDEANAQAEHALSEWINTNEKQNYQLCLDMET